MSQKKKNRYSLINMVNRVISTFRLNGGAVTIQTNGENNQYPNEIEALVLNSPTASSVTDTMSDFISGQDVSVDNFGEAMNNKSRKLINLASKDISKQKGAYFHIPYKLKTLKDGTIEIERDFPTLLPFTDVRKSNEDDAGNYYFVYGEFGSRLDLNIELFGSNKDFKTYYKFNPKKSVVLQQIDEDYKRNNADINDPIEKKIRYYRGQVYFLNFDENLTYPYSLFHSARPDMATEYKVSEYMLEGFGYGFLGKKGVIVNGSTKEVDLYKIISSWMGTAGANKFPVIDVTSDNFADMKIEDMIKTFSIDSNYNEKMVKDTNERIEKNILRQAKLPKILFYSDDNSMFGQSGESMRVAFEYYNAQTRNYRSGLEEAFFEMTGKKLTIHELKIYDD